MPAPCWFLIYFLFVYSNVYLFLLPFCVFFLVFPLFLVSLLSFKLNLIYFFVCFSPPFSLSSLLPLFHFFILLFKLFFTSSIFLLTYFHGFLFLFLPTFFSFIFYLTFVYLSSFPLFHNLFSPFSPYIFLLCRYFSPFTFSHHRPSCFILSLHNNRNPR